MNLYYDLYKYLYDHYDINSGPSLDNFAKARVRKSQKLIDIRDIKNMLNDLEKRGIITWKADVKTTNQDGVYSYHWLDIPKYKNDLGKEGNNTFDNIRVEAHLTPDVGLEYVANILNREATLLTNKSMKTLTIVLVVIGVVTIFLQGLQCDISRRQLEQSQSTTKSSTTDSKDTSHETIYSACDSSKQKNGDSNKTNHTDTTTPNLNLFNNSHKPK